MNQNKLIILLKSQFSNLQTSRFCGFIETAFMFGLEEQVKEI